MIENSKVQLTLDIATKIGNKDYHIYKFSNDYYEIAQHALKIPANSNRTKGRKFLVKILIYTAITGSFLYWLFA